MSQKMLEAIGLSAAYRAIWAEAQMSDDKSGPRPFARFSARLEAESIELLELSEKLSRYVSESCLSPFLDLDSSALKALLPKATVKSLQRFGYRLTPDATGEDGASTPIRDETLSHYGLRYLEKAELRSIENRDVIDAGSFDGSSARFFLQNHPVQRVFCFEPDPANFAHLMNDSLAELSSGRIVATQVALSNRMGLAIMSPAGMGSSRAKAELVEEPRIVVRSKTIDGFLKDFPEANIGLIKLDVEGDGVLALQGAVQTIRTHRPVLIVSFYHTPQEFAETPPYLLDTFPEYSFRVRKVAPNLFKEHVMIGVPKTT